MNLQLNAIYLNESQLEYIIAVKGCIEQDLFNFEFEYFDAQNAFCELHAVKTFPSFYLLKNGKIAAIIEGKLEYKELKERLLNITYVNRSTQ